MPTSLLRIVPEMTNKVAEYFTDDKGAHVVKFFDVDDPKKRPNAFRFDQNAINVILKNPKLIYRIGLTIDKTVSSS